MSTKKVEHISVLVLLIVASAVALGTAESQPLAPTQQEFRIPGLIPPLLPFNGDIRKCWSTLVDIEGCRVEILDFLFTFQLRFGPACCKAIIGLSENCLPAVFSSSWGWGRGIPFNPQYPEIAKGYCASITGGKTSPPAASFGFRRSPPTPVSPQVRRGAPEPAPIEPPTASVASVVMRDTALASTQLDTFRIPGLFIPEFGKCWSTLVDIEGCKAEILNFIFTFQLRLGPACCKAINDLNEICLPAIFSWSWGWGRGIPFNPQYPNLVKGYCASITGEKSSPPAPSSVHFSPPSPQLGSPKPVQAEPPTTSV